MEPDAADQKTALKEFLDYYPTLADYRTDGPDGRLDWLLDSEPLGMHRVRLFWNLAQPIVGQPAEPLEEKVATLHRGQYFVFPALGDNPKPLHPLLAWWAVLYALSMLARYEPCAWNKRSNIDISMEAVAIEHLLEAALEYLPRVILDTIDQVYWHDHHRYDRGPRPGRRGRLRHRGPRILEGRAPVREGCSRPIQNRTAAPAHRAHSRRPVHNRDQRGPLDTFER